MKGIQSTTHDEAHKNTARDREHLNAAASAAWLVKAARASALTEVDPPESGIVTSKVFDNCRAMARIYAAKRNLTLAV